MNFFFPFFSASNFGAVECSSTAIPSVRAAQFVYCSLLSIRLGCYARVQDYNKH